MRRALLIVLLLLAGGMEAPAQPLSPHVTTAWIGGRRYRNAVAVSPRHPLELEVPTGTYRLHAHLALEDDAPRQAVAHVRVKADGVPYMEIDVPRDDRTRKVTLVLPPCRHVTLETDLPVVFLHASIEEERNAASGEEGAGRTSPKP